MEEIVNLLHEGNYSCVVRNGGVYTFTRCGVADLFDMLEHRPDLLKGADVADKVVGKGAAALMILGGVARLHADVMSEQALCLLERYSVPTDRGVLVPFIENRLKTGWCPVEKLCRDAGTPEECLSAIRKFLSDMKEREPDNPPA